MCLAGKNYRVLALLGKGKGGYSYLVSDGQESYVLKQIHHEPCQYYSFGDKLAAELRDYARLAALQIPMPRLLAVDEKQERLLKEYIPGPTVQQLGRQGGIEPWHLEQVQAMSRRLMQEGLNIDYYPSNFIPHNGTLYYVDYECNPYMQQWDLLNWGMAYWKNETS